MLKTFYTIALALLLALSLVSCSFSPTHNISKNETYETFDSTDTNEILSNETEASDKEQITGIELHAYPDPYRVREYGNLTDDQKIAYNAISEVLLDITSNGIDPKKTYKLDGHVSTSDFMLAYDIICANFPSADQLIGAISGKDSMGTQQYYDSIVMVVDDNYNEYIDRYNEAIAEADKILKTIEHNNTEYSKALAIAKWICDNIPYAHDYTERVGDELNNVYTALVKREAVCGGLSTVYDLLCKKAGLETIYVRGDCINPDLAGHAWNMICISDKWYYVDVTWMSTSGNMNANFMMPKTICDELGHNEYTYYYYWDRENNTYILPEANSYDLYYSYFANIDELINYLENSEPTEEYFYLNVYVSNDVAEVLSSMEATEITSNLNGEKLRFTVIDKAVRDDNVVMLYIILT
ncbi:MAG: hypothetical protein IKT46_04460 [Clostridia bacterium]|nr:hypothetical protein [Clostridia bacterium]